MHPRTQTQVVLPAARLGLGLLLLLLLRPART